MAVRRGLARFLQDIRCEEVGATAEDRYWLHRTADESLVASANFIAAEVRRLDREGTLRRQLEGLGT